jgi:GntR family transcriptional regulator, transcriptional repressor for pyruvate dehydrogenase complex
MALQRVERRSVPDDVFEQILGEVMGGVLAPGETLPSERRLAEVLGVSRPAVREALQRLSHAGLVDVRQGDATTVRDFRREGGLDLLPSLLLPRGELDIAVARSVLEARLHIAPKIAELAALRRGSAIADALAAVIEELDAATDLVERQRHALAFWEHLVDAADSITFRLMLNSLRAAYEPALEALAPIMSMEVDQVSNYRAVAHAVTSGNPRQARLRAEKLLTPATTALIAAIDQLEQLS